jgi:hypothetical protein
MPRQRKGSRRSVSIAPTRNAAGRYRARWRDVRPLFRIPDTQ